MRIPRPNIPIPSGFSGVQVRQPGFRRESSNGAPSPRTLTPRGFNVKQVIGKKFQSLAVSEVILPVGQQSLDLDLKPEQIRSLQRWLLTKRQNRETPFMVLLTQVSDGENQRRNRKKIYGSVAVLVRVTRLFKETENERHTLEYVGLDRCRWKSVRSSQVGIDTVMVTRSIGNSRKPTKDALPRLERQRQKIIALAAELKERDPSFSSFHKALQSVADGDFNELSRRLFWHAEILGCSPSEHHVLLEQTQFQSLFREFFRLLERRKDSSGSSNLLTMSDIEVEQALGKAGVPNHGIEALRLDIKARADDTASYHRLLNTLRFPWNKVIPWNIDLAEAQEKLEREYVGRPDEKRWVMAFLEHLHAVGQQKKVKPTCFVGPPGTGKTSLVEFLGKHLGLPMESGSVMTTEDLVGANAIYQGARPGMLFLALQRLGRANPIIIFEEIDQVGEDNSGSVHAALLNLFDPKRNHAVRDLYLGFDIDYSQVTFMATANRFELLPEAVRQRLRRVDFSPYTSLNKFAIVENDVLPNLLRARKKNAGSVVVPRPLLLDIIQRRTHEGGVRELTDHLERLLMFALQRHPGASNENPKVVTLLEAQMDLGEAPRKPIVRVDDHLGKAVGVGVDDYGGSVDVIEVAISPKPTKLTDAWQVDTGLQARDMREVNRTVRAALAKNIGFIGMTMTGADLSKERREEIENILWRHAILIHMPPPGEETSGPSAGIITALALIRELFKIDLRHKLVVTGSLGVDLGIIPIGGERLKLHAMREAGAEHLLFPEKNRANVLIGLRQMVYESKWADDGIEEVFPAGEAQWQNSPTLQLRKKGSEAPIFTVYFAKDFSDVLQVAFPEEARKSVTPERGI